MGAPQRDDRRGVATAHVGGQRVGGHHGPGEPGEPQTSLTPHDLLTRWDVTLEELTRVVDENPSLRGMIFGYLAELKLETMWLSSARIGAVAKPDDHDRSQKGDRIIRYRGGEFVFESKSLQTATVKAVADGWIGKAQVDASDRRTVTLPDGSSVTTTCLLRNEFDLLAVNVFAFENKWRFAFARNTDLPGSRFRGYSDYQRAHLLATLVEVTWPPKPPFREEPFTLMNEILQERSRST